MNHSTNSPSRLGQLALSCAIFFASAGIAGAATNYEACDVEGPNDVATLTTLQPGVLTVRPYLPAPGYWNGNSPDQVKDGFEYCLAANIAHRAGLDTLKLVMVSFAQVVAGQTGSFDIAISQASITDERKKVVDFTTPYYDLITGVMVRTGTAMDSQKMQQAQLGAERGTTQLNFITDHIRPKTQPKVFSDTASMYAALAARQVDAVVFDASTLLTVAAASDGRFTVSGTYPQSHQEVGGIVGKNSPNLAAFNKIIESIKADGTLEKLNQRYLVPMFKGVAVESLPHYTVRD